MSYIAATKIALAVRVTSQDLQVLWLGAQITSNDVVTPFSPTTHHPKTATTEREEEKQGTSIFWDHYHLQTPHE
jgi:hypothetical protein